MTNSLTRDYRSGYYGNHHHLLGLITNVPGNDLEALHLILSIPF